MKKYILVALFLMLFSCAYPGAKDEDAIPKEDIITGRLYFMGTGPVTSMGLNTFDGRSYAVLSYKEIVDDINRLQDKVVTIKGYVDLEIMYPMQSIIIEEYKKIEAESISGSLSKKGAGINAAYYIQSEGKSYKIVTEKVITLESLIGVEVEIKGYIYETGEPTESIYLIKIKKKG